MTTDSDNGAPIPAYVSTSASAESTWQDLVVSGFKKKDNKKENFIDGDFEDIEDEDDRKI